jgi:hypothetical protein
MLTLTTLAEVSHESKFGKPAGEVCYPCNFYRLEHLLDNLVSEIVFEWGNIPLENLRSSVSMIERLAISIRMGLMVETTTISNSDQWLAYYDAISQLCDAIVDSTKVTNYVVASWITVFSQFHVA